ncbi:MAG: hypothetical protein R3F43_17855 [bacterium]
MGRSGLIGLWVLLALGCDEAATEAADAGGQCLASDLIRQCPPGANPILGATATGLCSGGSELRNMQGQVTGQCYGEGRASWPASSPPPARAASTASPPTGSSAPPART